MESGLLLLIDEVVDRLSGLLGVRREQLVEYVLNESSSWEPNVPSGNEEVAYDAEVLRVLLAELDAAILGTVENLDCDNASLADILDQALRSSLWHRRLLRRADTEQAIQRAVLSGRARWIWVKSDSRRRRAFFAAGVGLQAGQFLERHLPTLLADLSVAEQAIAEGRTVDASAAIAKMAEVLFRQYPFAPGDLPENWRDLIAAWIRGTALGTVVGENASEEIAFIQQSLVYQLVWGVEAVRVYASSGGDEDALGLTGLAALALTYGAPTATAALLLQAGLTSRPMAVKITSAFPATFSNLRELDTWIAGVASAIDSTSFWDSPDEQEEWRAFLSHRHQPTVSTWDHTEYTLDVVWDDSHKRQPGTPVRLIDDAATRKTFVCDLTLCPIGKIRRHFVAIRSGYVQAEIGPDGDSVTVTRWGSKTRVWGDAQSEP